jgi:hypothetical protein
MIDHALYREISESRGIQVGGPGRRPQVLATSTITGPTFDPTEKSTRTKQDDESEWTILALR